MARKLNPKAPKAERSFPFTDDRLDALTPPPSGELIVYDAGGKQSRPHLALRVTPGGAKTFIIYRRVRGTPKKVRLGPFRATDGTGELTVKQARAKADLANARITEGEDPTVDRSRDQMTLGEVFDWWLDSRGKVKKRTWQQDQETFDRHLKKHANKTFVELDADWLQALHTRISKSAPVAANRVLSLLSVLFTRYYGKGRTNPTREVERNPEKPKARSLSAEELSRFIAAIDAYEAEGGNADHADVLRVLLWTGQRRGNVFAMRWDDLDLGDGLWTIPAEVFKNGKVHVASLSGPALDVLRRRRTEQGESPYVFPGRRRNAEHVTDIRHAFWRVLALAGIEKGTFRIHDIRATFATMMAKNRETMEAIAGQLGHRDLSTTKRYIELAKRDVSDAVGRTTDAMLRLAQRKESA